MCSEFQSHYSVFPSIIGESKSNTLYAFVYRGYKFSYSELITHFLYKPFFTVEEIRLRSASLILRRVVLVSRGNRLLSVYIRMDCIFL